VTSNQELVELLQGLGRRRTAECVYRSWRRLNTLAARCVAAAARDQELSEPLGITLVGKSYELQIVGMSCQPAGAMSPARLRFTCTVELEADLYICEVAFESGSPAGKLSYKGSAPAKDTEFFPSSMKWA